MNNKTKTGLEILQSSVLLGITGDMLLRQTPWGLNVFLWIGLLVVAMIAITFRRKSEHWTTQTIALHGALLFFAGMYVWRDSMELKVLNFLAILTILAVLVLPALKLKTHATGLFHYGIGWLYAACSAMLAPFLILFDDINWKTIPNKGWSKHLISVIRGLAIALPILFVFGGLFMAADAVFQGIIEDTFNVDPDLFLGHLILIGFITWVVAGYLRATVFDFSTFGETVSVPKTNVGIKKQVPSVTAHILNDTVKEEKSITKQENSVDRLEASAKTQAKVNGNKAKAKTKKDAWNWRNFDNSVLPEFLTLGLIETSIVLGLINLLFLAFVVVQIPYLFGGMDLVQSTPDFKLAEYARRGFGELVTVSALVLPILLLSHWLLRKNKPINEKIFRVLAGVQIGLLFVIMVSASQRLFLLTGNLGYGLTTVRFYPMIFMIFLVLVFLWFGVTVLRGARHQFAWGTLWLALFMVGTLHVMNPDDFIVRTNIKLMEEGRAFDVYYNSSYLSADAIPALVDGYDSMNAVQKCEVRRRLYAKYNQSFESDFRAWNYSRWIGHWRLYENKLLESPYEDCPASHYGEDDLLRDYVNQ